MQGHPNASMPCICGSMAHEATAGNSPSRVQTVRLSYTSFRQEPQRFGHNRLLYTPASAVLPMDASGSRIKWFIKCELNFIRAPCPRSTMAAQAIV
jgi:hypothetical protein